VRQCPVFSFEAILLELPATLTSGFCLLGILYLFLEAWPPVHCFASAHFFSEISA